MGLVKRTYVDQETVITAENLNDIQDAIIENEEAIEDQGEVIEGKYAKPSGGIPASDMASGVQTSLGKADTAYQKPSGGIPSTDLASGVQTSLGKADTAYQKPSGGIPSTDMASAVQTSLGKADTAYQKPSGGIPSTDLASAVQTSLGKADTAYQKPSGGIPASDMASAVQTSLDKADSALQAVPNTYRTAAAQDVIDADKVDKSDYNPESKTSAMTQPVGVDANGKLWTQPPSAAAQSDWSETDTTSPAFIKNKPTIPDVSQLEDDVEDLQDIVGDGALDSDFTATDLTGAANELKDDVSDVRNTLSTVKSDLGIVEDTNTATHTIAAGQYVIWKDALYIASAAIPLGTTLSLSNLTAVSGGGFNNLYKTETISGWTCRTAPDGLVECWRDVTATVSYAASGGAYRGSVSVNYPFSFSTYPLVLAVSEADRDGFWGYVVNVNNKERVDKCAVTLERMSAASGSETIAVYLRGTRA